MYAEHSKLVWKCIGYCLNITQHKGNSLKLPKETDITIYISLTFNSEKNIVFKIHAHYPKILSDQLLTDRRDVISFHCVSVISLCFLFIPRGQLFCHSKDSSRCSIIGIKTQIGIAIRSFCLHPGSTSGF